MEFKCSRGKLEWAVTGSIGALVLVLTGLFSYQAWMHRQDGQAFALTLMAVGMAVISLLLLIGPLLYAPLKYEITDEGITVRRLGPDVTIGRENIRSIAVLGKSDTGLVIRTCGDGGLYGYVGWFHGSKIGSFRALMSRRSPFVLVTLKAGKKIALSPDAGVEFVRCALERFEME